MRPPIMLLFLTVLLELPVTAQRPCQTTEACEGQKICRANQEPKVCERCGGPLSFRTTKGIVHGRVAMEEWMIANGEIVEIPHQGLLIVHLCAGALTTDIGNERKEWREGSFFTVPADKRLIVQTTGDSVVLRTVDFITL